jgi:hypothetical protein
MFGAGLDEEGARASSVRERTSIYTDGESEEQGLAL